MSIKNEKDLKGMEKISFIAAVILDFLVEKAVPGTTTLELDRLCKEKLAEFDALSAPKKHYQAPCYAFYSKNADVVHGLPDNAPLKVGDLLTIDITPQHDGYIADTARTLLVGGRDLSGKASALMNACEDAFYSALSLVSHGTPVRELGRAIEKRVHSQNFFVVRELCGHGLGRSIHEEPSIPNYYVRQQKDIFKEGMIVAVEPMISLLRPETAEKPDGWTITVGRGNLAAHYEHTLLVTKGEPVILTRSQAA